MEKADPSMNDPDIITSILSALPNAAAYPLVPATPEQIAELEHQALSHGLPEAITSELVAFFTLANAYQHEFVLHFHSCDDIIIFEWWNTHRELWLSQSDFYTIRWKDRKFCLGDAANVSFSPDEAFPTLPDLLRHCAQIINAAHGSGPDP
jgi:hypothetical protein